MVKRLYNIMVPALLVSLFVVNAIWVLPNVHSDDTVSGDELATRMRAEFSAYDKYKDDTLMAATVANLQTTHIAYRCTPVVDADGNTILVARASLAIAGNYLELGRVPARDEQCQALQ